jgi:hypothetical protein
MKMGYTQEEVVYLGVALASKLSRLSKEARGGPRLISRPGADFIKHFCSKFIDWQLQVFFVF